MDNKNIRWFYKEIIECYSGADSIEAEETEELIRKYEKAGVVGLLVIGGAAICYGIYKTAPKAKKWWKARKEHNKAAEWYQ